MISILSAHGANTNQNAVSGHLYILKCEYDDATISHVGEVSMDSQPSLISDDPEGLDEDDVLTQQFGIFFEQRLEPVFWHGGNEVVEQAALTK